MESLIVLLFTGLAAATLSDTAFEAGRRYTYRYEGQAVTGVPYHGVEYAGLKIKANCGIQVGRHGKVQLQLDDVRVCQLQQEMSLWPDSGIIPDNLCSSVDPDVSRLMTRELGKPVTFIYEQGEVVRLTVTPSDPDWSVNVKKAIISTVMIKSSRDNSVDEMKSWFDRISGLRDELSDIDTPIHVTTTMETDVVGTCETRYELVKPSNSLDNTIKLFKVKNYRNCLTTPHYQEGIFTALNIMPKEYTAKDFIDRSTTVKYELAGSPGSYYIKSIRQDGKFIVTPMSQEEGSAVTSTLMLMNLIETSNMGSDVEILSDGMDRPEGLLSSVGKSEINKPFRQQPEEEIYGSSEKQNKIDTLLNEVVPIVHTSANVDAVEKIRKIESIIRTMSVTELLSVSERYITDATSNTDIAVKKRDIWLDILPSSKNPNVVKAVATLITKEMISIPKAVFSLKLASLNVNPDLDLLTYMKPQNPVFCAHSVVLSNPILESSAYKALGNLMRRYMIQQNNTGVPMYAVSAAMNQRFPASDFISTLHTITHPKVKSEAIKSMGISGRPIYISTLAKYATNKHESPLVRKNAIMSLENMPAVTDKKIENILLSIYSDRTDLSGIRISAFIALIDRKSQRGTLDAIVMVQRGETDIEVGSLVSSYLYSMSTAQLPGMNTFSHQVREILPKVRAIMPNTFHHAKGYYTDYFSKDKELGVGLEFFKSTCSKLPSNIFSRLHLHALGKTFKALSGGVYMTGLDSILNKLSGVERQFIGSLSGKSLVEIFETLLRPVDKSNIDLGSMAGELQDIVQKLGISTRNSHQDLHAGIFLKLFGNDIIDFDVTAEDFLTFLQTGEFPLIGNVKDYINQMTSNGNSLDFLKILHLGTSSQQVVTPLGVPVMVNATTTAVTRVVGDLSLRGTNFLDVINYITSGQIPSELTLQGNVKPSMALEIVAHSGVNLGPLSTGVAVTARTNVKIPRTLEVTFNKQTRKLFTKINMPAGEKDETKVVKAEIVPETYVIIEQPSRDVLNKKFTTKTFSKPKQWEEVQIEVPIPITILNSLVTVQWQSHQSNTPYTSMDILWGKTILDLDVAAIDNDVPLEIEITCHPTLSNYRTQARGSIFSDGLTINSLITKPSITKVEIAAGTRSNKATVGLALAMSEDMWLHQVNAHVAVPGIYELPASLSVFINLKKISDQLYGQAVVSDNNPVLEFQLTTQANRKLNVKVSPYNDQPRSWDKWTNNIYFRTIESMTGSQIKVTKTDSSEPKKEVNYGVTVDVENIDWNRVEMIGGILFTYVRNLVQGPYALPQVDVRKISASPSTSMQGLITIDTTLNKITAILRSPTSTEYAMELPINWAMFKYQLITLEKPLLYKNTPTTYIPSKFPMEYFQDTCTFEARRGQNENFVSTFDHYSYMVPSLPGSCEVVLAQDCAYNTFSLIATPSEETNSLRVILPRHKIEITRRSIRGQLLVKADDQAISLTDREVIPLRDTISRTYRYGEVEKNGEWVTVHLPLINMKLKTDGKTVVLKTNIKGTLCGLCGNNNDNRIDEYQGPDMRNYPNNKLMISKYVLQSASCSTSRVRQQYRIDDLDIGACQMAVETILKEQGDRTCFSKQPVSKCPEGCRPEDETRQRVQFHCKHTNDFDTRSMLQDRMLGKRIFREMSNEETHARARMNVPTKCVPNW